MAKLPRLRPVMNSLAVVSLVVSGCGTSHVMNGTTAGIANRTTSTTTRDGSPNTQTNSASNSLATSNAVGTPPVTGSPSTQAGGPGTGQNTSKTESSLVPYNGPFQHIFYHPLIAFPNLTFSKADPQLQGFNDFFVTVSEFNKMLSLLYQHNYILVDINSLYTVTTVYGKTYIHKNTLMLPKGKIPLVLSVDDMNYYPYMQQWGTVQRLVLDANGNVAALSKYEDGHTAITHDNAIVPILDSFVEEHPDFSLNGAKGMINLTGYAGVLGYRTNDTSAPDYEDVKSQAMQVIAHLKKTGWTFASHSWGHLDDANISYTTFKADTDRWLKEVEPLTGPTQVYVYPFGSRVQTGGAKYEYLISKGFHVFCGVGPTTYVEWKPEVLMMDRRHIDGIALHNERRTLNDLFGTTDITDPIRPDRY